MKRYIADIIIVSITFLFLLLLAGCAKTKPVSETIADNAVTATNALQQQLPTECKTEGIITQFEVIKTEIRSAKTACQEEKKVIDKERLKWKSSFWTLLVVIGLYFGKKFL